MSDGARRIGFGKTVNFPFDEAIRRTEAALAGQGFGVLTRIDVKDTLKKKLGEEMRPYVILGACNPPLAHQAITRAPEVGLLLPCNVVVRQTDAGEIRVEAINALTLSEMIPGADLAEVAEKVNALLERALDSLG